MELEYQEDIASQNIDVSQLRPGKSYDYLIENRNASMKEVLSDPERLKDFLKDRSCPVCASRQYVHELSKDSLQLVRCKQCDVVYVNPVFDEEKYLEIYKSQEYQQIVKKLGEDSHLYRKGRFGRERMDFIEKYHQASLPKKYMDVGCSTGFVVEEARDRGWEATGVELNPSAVQFARDRGLTVIDRPLEQIGTDERFSAISLFDVLEHMIHPAEILKNVKELLLDGGNVFIYVPNYNSASKLLAGAQNSHFIWPTHHLTYFTPTTLKSFLEHNGFEVLHWETQGLDIYDWLWFLNEKTNEDTKLVEKFAEPLQFYINAAGHGKNLRMFARKK